MEGNRTRDIDQSNYMEGNRTREIQIKAIIWKVIEQERYNRSKQL